MEKTAIKKIVHALPDECIKELKSLLSSNYEENQIIDLLQKYNINIQEILNPKKAQQ